MKEGYITLALNKNKYWELALNLALSIRFNDTSRPICLVKSSNLIVPEEYKVFFDNIIDIDPHKGHDGASYKLLMYKYTPYDKTMFVDSDCLLVKKDIDLMWSLLDGSDFAMVGRKYSEENIASSKNSEKLRLIMKLIGSNTIIGGFNSGTYYFKNSTNSKRISDFAVDFFNKRKDELNPVLKHEIRHTYNDELYVSAAMSHFNQDPFPLFFKHNGEIKQWMQCMCGKRVVISCKYGICYQDNGNNCIESPTIAHFPGLCNLEIYLEQANWLRKKYNLPLLKREDIK